MAMTFTPEEKHAIHDAIVALKAKLDELDSAVQTGQQIPLAVSRAADAGHAATDLLVAVAFRAGT